MSDQSKKVYKTLELTGTSSESLEDAIQVAVSKASHTVKNMRWFQIIDQRGSIEGDRVWDWQVTIKVGFHID